MVRSDMEERGFERERARMAVYLILRLITYAVLLASRFYVKIVVPIIVCDFEYYR